MKLFEKIRRFIRGADRAVTNAICERLDNTAEKLENFARNLDPEAFQEAKMRESWEGRLKTDPETAARLAQMPMKKNIPKGHPEWSLVKCPICGQECWRPMSRQELRQKKMQAACTECGLKIESRRNQP